MRLSAFVPLAATALAGCAAATMAAPGAPATQDTCKREAGQRFIGGTASAAIGAEMLRATGATRLRWVPPRTAVTMEYGYGRLTVGYDDAKRIVSVSCG